MTQSYKDIILPYGEQIRTGTSDSILAGLYRSILDDLQIPQPRFLMAIGRYVERTIEPSEIKEASSIRGNLKKELLRSVMSWKVFVKGLMVLNIKKFVIALDLKIPSAQVQQVQISRVVILDPKEITSDKDLSKTESILSTLFRDINAHLDVDTKKFNQLIAEYIVRANIPLNLKEVSSTRGNLKKELMKNTMTWKVFIKGLLFLKVSRFDIGVSLHHVNGKVTSHFRSVNLSEDHDA